MARFSFSHGSDVLSGIKSKLGFSDGGSRRDYDDYDDYDDASYEDEYADDPYRGDYAYDNLGPGFFAPFGQRGAARSSRRVRASFRSRTFRSSTQAPDPLSHDPLAARHVVTTSDERPRTTTSDAIRSGAFASGMRAARSAGYNSLFESTAAAASGEVRDAGASLSSSSAGMPSDPTIPVFQPKRSVTVLKPTAYDEVEQIAKSLKAGDAVVLQLMNTQNAPLQAHS